MDKIIVIGSPGAGKSTLARKLRDKHENTILGGEQLCILRISIGTITLVAQMTA